MDANGTRYHLLLGRRDWARCTDAAGVSLHEVLERRLELCTVGAKGVAIAGPGQELSLRPCLEEFPTAAGDSPPSIGSRASPQERVDRRGAARDRYGNFYWIDESRAAMSVLSAGSGRTSRFWPPAEPEVPAPRYGEFAPRDPVGAVSGWRLEGLAVTDDHHLLVGTSDPGGFLVFDLHAGGDPQQLCWPGGQILPFDLAARPQGGVWILDRRRARVWQLDRHLNVRFEEGAETPSEPPTPDLFQPMTAGRLRAADHGAFPQGIALEADGVVDPIAIESVGPDGFVVLDRNPGADFSVVWYHGPGHAAPIPLPLERFGLVGYDLALLPTPDNDAGDLGRLFIVSSGGNQTFEFTLGSRGGTVVVDLVSSYRPMRLFGGKGLVAAGDRVFYDFANGWVPLAEQRRPRYATEGTVRTFPLDGREFDCVWHRLLIDACIPPGTEISVLTRAANDQRELGSAAWQREPRLYLRPTGSELPYLRAGPKRDTLGDGTWELLFQRARGRYLQLALTLAGDGRRSPRIRALRAYYPRFSYLTNYLPAVYREDRESASFLDRFLANLEGIHTGIEDRIAAVQALWDPDAAPAGALPWLASWLGVALDPAWDERRRRLFIRHAMDFFRWRGTTRGLLMAAELAVGRYPDEDLFAIASRSRYGGVRIVERYRTRRTPPVVVGDPTTATGPRQIVATPTWQPAAGAVELYRRYADALAAAGLAKVPAEVTLAPPEDPQVAAVWHRFMSQTLGFVPAAPVADARRWREFLIHRYQRISALNQSYGTSANPYGDFAEVALPILVPLNDAALRDWYEFERIVLTMQALAHRFTVMLPVRAGGAEADQRGRLAHLRRVIELEKPAHTVFDVRFYWALFRLGEARLGLDTVVELGGRAPELMPPAALGQTYLAEGFLSPRPPLDATDRYIVGRERMP